ncbi:MAG: HesA/MoeB/ThiF family protein [Desulfobacterales bacterium]|nr:HesA/MoeB/ThiF family protein [Desulfobacterales bacterium]
MMPKELTNKELETYSRQIVLADIGYDGQLKLRNAKACLIGVGGLGSPIATQLVGMGIGHLRIVDRDIVSRSDLHRQHLYDADCVGLPKVEIAQQKLSKLNPDVKLDPIPESLNSINAEELIGGMDVVIDGLDRPEPRYLVNRTCNRLKIPYVFGAAIEAFGNVSTLLPGQTFCLECFMPGLKDEDLPVCGVVGVHPSVLGIVSSVQVSEAVRLLIGQEPKLFNKLLYIDLRELEFNILDMQAVDSCKVCGVQPDGLPEEIKDRFFEETCARDGRRNFVLSPKKRLTIDLNKLGKLLKKRGIPLQSEGNFGTTFKPFEDIQACILKSGTMIAQTPPDTKETIKDRVFDIYRSIMVDGLGLSHNILPDVV